MIFSKKYVFETKATKLKRFAVNSLVLIFFLHVLFISFCLYIPISAKQQTQETIAAFYQRQPDLIVVFTGDDGRIRTALDIAKKNQSTKVLISGVYAANTLATLLKNEKLEEDFARRVEIDYLAQNTQDNVFYTIRFLRQENLLKSVMIISSDYHLMRIKVLLNNQLSENDNYQFYFYGTSTDYSAWRNIKILLKEALKILRSIALYFS